MRLVPEWARDYHRYWLAGDIAAGLTLAAVAIPEVMGYTSIAGTPIATGIYTIIVPTLVFALLGSSRLLVVGADSATAAILAAGLTGLGISGLAPGTDIWLAWAGLVALLCAVFLFLARLLGLGFLGDFLSAPVLIGFLTGVGIQVLTGQIPDLLGVAAPDGNWLVQQWKTITGLPAAHPPTLAFAAATLACIVGFKRFVPRVPGAVVAVVLSLVVSAAVDASSHGVAVVGEVRGGFPPVGLPSGLAWADVGRAVPIAFACVVLIIAQSSATSRSFGARHGQRVNINRDLLGLGGANLAAGLTGTFVVNGSPTKTAILDDQGGRTQMANIVMALVALVFVVFGAGLLTDMPKSVLAAIVVVIAAGLIDVRGLRRLHQRRFSEFVIAAATAVVVILVGTTAGIAFAVVLSILEIIRRAYRPSDFVIGKGPGGTREYIPAKPGVQSSPGLIVFRFDAQLFFANANRFLDDVIAVVDHAPDPVRLLVLDCSSIDDVDYSASAALSQLIDHVHQRGARFGLVRADTQLVSTLRNYGVLDQVSPGNIFTGLGSVFSAFARRGAQPE